MRLSGLSIAWLGLGALCLILAPLSPLLALAAYGLDALLLILLISDAFLLHRVGNLRVTRTHNEIFSLGAQNAVTIALENPSPFSLRFKLRDTIPDKCESEQYAEHGTLTPYGLFSFPYQLRPLERGVQGFGPLTVRLQSPFGFWLTQRQFLDGGTVKVYPNIKQTGQTQLLTRQIETRVLGIHRLRISGQGAEFESLRDYLPDDELRKVDWKASARRGSLITREYDVERSQQIMFMLDMGRTMASHLDYMTKLDHAINAAVLLTYVSGRSHDRIGITAFADDIVSYLPPGKGGTQLTPVLEQLYPLQPRQVEANYRLAFSYVANRLRKRSLIILFTDLIDPDSSRRLLDNLRLLHPRHLVLCVALSDYELKGILHSAPTDADSLFQQAMATAVIEDRELALGQLHQQGILTVDAAPSDLSVAVVNKYLTIKREGRI